jgi:Ala-tRNA(Pro) deacylase
LIEVVGRRVGDKPRTGQILDVLGDEGSVHYRVRWDDGHESVFYPGAGTRIRKSEHAQPQLPPVSRDVVETLTEAGVAFELLPHKRTRSATGEALALGVLPQETAKTVVVRAQDETIRAVVPASRRLSLVKLGRIVGHAATLLGEAELDGAYPQFELGAVPPFGGPGGDRVIVDSRIAGCEYVVLEAGSHQLSLRMTARDLIEVAQAEVADIAVG